MVGKRLPRAVAVTVTVVLLALGLTAIDSSIGAQPPRAAALDGSQFNAGNIISDTSFFNATTMSVGDIQNFFAGQESGCTAAGGMPCLKDYTETTFSRAAVAPGHCQAYAGAVAESAAQIIWKVAQACAINPQVLIVTLQKEQGLVTSLAPTSGDYRIAMGYGCPDTAPCDAQYYGFYNQVYNAAWQFRQYTQYPSGRRYGIGATYIQYNPNTACGGSTVNIQNQATANLYLYTPYQPNAAALANLGGVGDACSAYGNRNFWVYMNTWFPATIPPDVPFGNLEVGTTTLGSATLRGWAIDPNTPDPITVHLYVNGVWGGAFTANLPRPDIAMAYPQSGANHGFQFTFPIGQGPFTACVYGINVGPGYNNLLGCMALSAPTGPPIGNIDSAVLTTPRSVTLTGWTLDPDTGDSITVHAYINGAWAGAYTANVSRPDVARAYPPYGPAHGFSISLPMPVGTNQVCLYGINVGGGYNQTLGCRTLSSASGPPIGNFEAASSTPTGAHLSGWAIDPDTPNPIAVHAYVNGVWGGAYQADASRPDIARVYDGYGANHGISIDIPLPGGTNQVCLYGINVGGGYNNSIGCQTIVRPSGPPFGSIDAISAVAGSLSVSGWAFDPDTANPIAVHMYIDGQWAGAYTADGARPDVASAYPYAGATHGFSITRAFPPGTHSVCLYGINVGPGYNASIGCRTVSQ